MGWVVGRCGRLYVAGQLWVYCEPRGDCAGEPPSRGLFRARLLSYPPEASEAHGPRDDLPRRSRCNEQIFLETE